ncbi:MAG: chloride channel protein [Acidimicrobiia bacterium]
MFRSPWSSRALLAFRSRSIPLYFLVGAVGGLGGAAFVGLLSLLGSVVGPDNIAGGAAQCAVLFGAGVLVAVLTRLLGSSGNVDLLVDNIHVLGGAADIRGLRSLIPTSLVCIASGGALGPEAPLVQSTGSAGTWLAQSQRKSPRDTRVLTITGMAAGFAVLFGAPIGSGVFALEILHRRGLEYYEALIPAMVGALTGYVVYIGVSTAGLAPVWSFPAAAPTEAIDLVPAAVMGVVGALIAVAFIALSRIGRFLARGVPVWALPAIGGVVLGLLALWNAYALTFGEGQLEDLLVPGVGVGTLVAAGTAKLLASTTCLATGWKGGFIIPLFFIGAAAGTLAHHVAPGAHTTVLVSAGMVAACVGVTKTPLGSTLVVAEMAGLTLTPMLLVAALVSFLLTRDIGHLEAQRHRADSGTTDEGASS